jgi:Carboxypeptidase regulatory-like domain
MTIGTGRANVFRMLIQGLAIAFVLVPWITVAQGLTGALIGTVTDSQGGVISGAVVRISSPALIGGELTTKTDERGHLRFPSVPPGSYALEIVLEGFRPYRDADIYIGAGVSIERTPVLTLAALADSIVVHGPGSRLDARNAGFGTRFGAEDLDAIPMRRFSYQDWVKTAPGISPTSPAGSSVLVSAFGSGVDQNQYSSTARVSPRRPGGSPMAITELTKQPWTRKHDPKDRPIREKTEKIARTQKTFAMR